MQAFNNLFCSDEGVAATMWVKCLSAESAKERPGTLPVNAYGEENGSTELFNFSQHQDDALPSSLHEENVRFFFFFILIS